MASVDDAARLSSDGYDIDSVMGQTVTLYADDDELAALTAGGWKYRTVIEKSSPSVAGAGAKALGSYNGFAAMSSLLDGYATNYPDLCRKVSLGKSVQGRDIWAVKVTSNPDVPSDKPQVRFVATVHGNEPVGTELCLYFIDLLLKGCRSNDTRISNIVSNVELWFVPLHNPDGREWNPPQRYNANGYDLNRNFPEGSATDFGNMLYGPGMSTNGLQPETRAIMLWTASQHFTLGVHYHTGATVVNYPYDNDNKGSVTSPCPDDTLFQAMSRSYSSNNPPMWGSGYFANGVVNGAAWYAITGGVQDWSYRYCGSLDVTIELTDYQWPDPPASQLATYWNNNREAMLQWVEWSLRGVRGILRDAQTGAAVQGTLRVEGIHHLVFSDTDGDYHRVLLPGTYNLWFYAPGYVPQRITNVVVTPGWAARVDVAMQPVNPRFAAKISFQPATATIPAGFEADSGAAFGLRTSGKNYGWETALPAGAVVERRAGRSQDLRYDTLCQMQLGANHTWEIALPNGPYSVLIGAGDPAYATGTYQIQAENDILLDGMPTAGRPWVEALGRVQVSDGRLTLSSASGAASNRLAFVEISAVEPSTIAEWRLVYFGTASGTGEDADNADPDGDGLPNALEYAYGLNPTHADPAWKLLAGLHPMPNSPTLSAFFLRNSNASDLTWSVDVADHLATNAWSTLARGSNGTWNGNGKVEETPAGSNWLRVVVEDRVKLDSESSRFFRLKVTPP